MPEAWRDPKAFTRWFQFDYFRRPRRIRRAKLVVTALVFLACLGVAAAALRPGQRAVFQAGPLSAAHAAYVEDCAACHTEKFHTARRFWPTQAHASSVSDDACLACHEAGRHNSHQLQFFNSENNQAKNCAECHREHRGPEALIRLPDSSCTQCHADLQTDDKEHRYDPHVTRFDQTHHPAFGHWRGEGGLRDPGTITFSHKAHLDLADKWPTTSTPKDNRAPSHWREVIGTEVGKLKDQECQYCHKLDAAGRFMQPIRYAEHCAACHPLLPQLAGNWPEKETRTFLQTPLHHPGPGESAAKVRGELLERYSELILHHSAGPPPDRGNPARPAVLRSLLPMLKDQQLQVLDQQFNTERSLFRKDGGEPLPGIDQVHFDMRGGCAFCHKERGSADRADGERLPEYELPYLRERGKNVMFPTDRFDGEAYRFDRNRWFPHSQFNHEKHRTMDCVECHAASESTKAEQVLMPTIDACVQCHGVSVGKARSDCLECHSYHDHGKEHRGTRGQASFDAIRPRDRRAP
jgi:predicted CXXCH cytochrome family protein